LFCTQETESFWRSVKKAYETNELLKPGQKEPWRNWFQWVEHYPQLGFKPPELDPGFFTHRWAGRGKDYRQRIEPLDIANWYYRSVQRDICDPDTSSSKATRVAAIAPAAMAA
jgi:hypothetical protein